MKQAFDRHWFVGNCLRLGKQEVYPADDVELATEAVDRRLDELSRERELLRYVRPRIVSRDKEVGRGTPRERNSGRGNS